MHLRPSPNRARPAPTRRLHARRILASSALTLVALAAPQAAHAATTTFTVDSLINDNVVANTADATPGDGTCATAGNKCTLYAAIQEADALPASPGDDIEIVFDGALGAPGVQAAGVDLKMQNTGASFDAFSNDYLGDSFHFKIAAARPVTIDFDNRVPVTPEDDGNVGQFLIASDDVTLKNFPNISAGAGSITVAKDVQHTTISNGQCSDVSNIAETCIGLISGAGDVKITDVTSRSMFRFGLFVDRSQAGDAPISNVALTRFTSEGTQQFGDVWFQNDALVNGFSVVDSDFKANSGNADFGAFGFQPGTDVSNLTVDNSRFDGSGNTGLNWYGFFHFAGGKTTNTKITNSTFTKTFWAWADNGAGPHAGLLFKGNDFVNTREHVLDFRNSTYTDLLVEDNDFTDVLIPGNTDVWIGQPGTNNVISNNRFTQSDDAQKNRWAIYNDANVTPAASTGWAFLGNFIGGYVSAASGPIVNNGGGKTLMAKNTFGPATRGTLVPLESEAQGLWFVTNNNLRANDRIQTYRPTKAVTDGTTVKLTVAPVTPVLGANTAPTDPVTVDVFWTADDNAEEYIGRIPNVAGATTASLPTTHTTGRFRVQTLDADGRSSQYSAPAQTITDSTPPVAPVIAKVDGGTLRGTGEPGATVTVYDPAGKVIGTATVQPDGSWSIPGPLPCGTVLTAKQTDPAGNVSAVSAPLTTPACPDTTAPAAPKITQFDDAGNIRGTGEPAARVTVADQTGKAVGTATVLPDGTWVISAPLACGTVLTAKQADAAGNLSVVGAPFTAPACTAALTGVPQSVNDIILRCGQIPLALVDVKRGTGRTGRYAATTIVGVADTQYAGQKVAIRYLATNKVVGRATVSKSGSFSLKVADADPRNRTAENKRRYRAEIGGKRSLALKLTRRFDTTSVRKSGSTWTIKAQATRPFRAGVAVRVRVLNTCDGKSYRTVKTTRLSRTGSAAAVIAAPKAGSFQVVRLETSVPTTAKKGARLSKTYTVPRGS